MKISSVSFKKLLKSLKPYLWTFIVFLGSSLILIALEYMFNKPQSAWFVQLKKSILYPPEFLFPLIWIVVYIILIFVCTFSVHKSKSALLIINIAVTAVLHILWNLFFFTLYSPISGVLILTALAVLSISFLKMLLKINKTAGILSIIYIIWICYLLVLNYCILMIN